MLEVKDLQKDFGPIQAVRGISFSVARGEVLGFLGPNGAGKTTTMRIITGFLPPTAGTVNIEGYDIQEQPILAKKQMGYMPENAPVYADMTVWNYLRFIGEIRGYDGATLLKKMEQTIEQCHLESVKHRHISTLSKGFRQRVCMGQALLHNPPVLIMDEPTDGLDPNQKHLVRTMIREMASSKVIVISTHILEEVDAVCTRAMIICNGSIVADGSPAELRARDHTHGAVELTVDTVSGDMLAKLESLQSAVRVEFKTNQIIVYPRDSKRLFEEAVELVKANPDWKVYGLKVLEGRLEEVFRQLTTQPEARVKSS